MRKYLNSKSQFKTFIDRLNSIESFARRFEVNPELWAFESMFKVGLLKLAFRKVRRGFLAIETKLSLNSFKIKFTLYNGSKKDQSSSK